jgi:hypothetical protein
MTTCTYITSDNQQSIESYKDCLQIAHRQLENAKSAYDHHYETEISNSPFMIELRNKLNNAENKLIKLVVDKVFSEI